MESEIMQGEDEQKESFITSVNLKKMSNIQDFEAIELSGQEQV